MTLLEKKRFIIEKVQESNSDDFISKLYDDVSQIEPWDETDEGKNLILKVLEKSQQSTKEGKTHTFENVLNDVKVKYGLK